MTASLDALARIDDGIPLPGDAEIAAVFEVHCQWADTDFHTARLNAERVDWLTRQCPGCEDGGAGEPCADHFGPEDACTGCDVGTGTYVCDGCKALPGGEGGS